MTHIISKLAYDIGTNVVALFIVVGVLKFLV